MPVKPVTTNSRGLAETRLRMAKLGIDTPELTRRLGAVTQGRVRQILSGWDNPGFGLAGRFATVLGFEVGLFLEPYQGDAKSIPIPSGMKPGPGRGHTGRTAAEVGRRAAGRWAALAKRDDAKKKLQRVKKRAMEVKARRKKTRKTTSPERQITCLPRSTKSKRGDGKSQGGT